MAVGNQTLLIFVNGTRKALDSKNAELLFKALGFTSDGTDHGCTITESSAQFDFNAKKLTNVAAGTASGHAYEFDQAATALALKLSKTGGTMSGNIAMGGNKVTGTVAGTTSGDAVEYAQFIAGLAATGTSAEWQNSVVTATLVTPVGLTPTAGDRYIINGTGASGWATHDNQIATYVSGTVTLEASWTYQTPTVGTFTDADDNSGVLYYFGGASWTTKSFEATTASGFLEKTGFNITLAHLANGKIILGDSGGVAQPVTPTGDVTISNTGVNTIAAGAVTAAKLATVTDGTTLDQSGAGSTLEIKTGGVGATQLGSDAVTTAKILDANVTAAKLGSVTDGATLDQSGVGSTLEIKSLGVGTGQLAATSVTAAKLGSDVAGLGLTGGNGSALAADWSKSYINDNAGTISAGQVAYLKANGHVDLASKTTTTLSDFELLIVQDATIATTATGKLYVRRGGIAAGFTSLTIGKLVFVGATAGTVTQDVSAYTSGDFVYSLGRAVSATEVSYDPQFEYQVA